ncbi:Uncharacterized membrane protein YjgN, DUF898 family [Noviherbaspirillum humi]|uniref:Uncharacterized membrane protein YjgN, DUF898 family n=1 Tax=Noviherbaspirillum humi TaxID=1688639 RepID=A0A239GRL9_9BURK|nr:YjgN family protein [Noviherbaspirillum humi]SNS71869.1 Uncharacterized membrane protein YjgN, DUF898 family [Noviherbaspirillum humi]
MTTELSSSPQASALNPPAHQAKHIVEPFQFTGNGAEYFRIWIVNLALTVLTLGIYSAWAKVRKTRYFYRHTRLDGCSFEYHGDPVAILKGRIVMVVIAIAYQFVAKFSTGIAGVLSIAMTVLIPILMWKSLQFKLHNTSYRGVRFRFIGSRKKAYSAFLLWPSLSGLSLGCLGPLAYQRLKRFQHGESAYGVTRFGFTASAKDFYRVFGKWALVGIPIILVSVLGFGMLIMLLQKTIDSPEKRWLGFLLLVPAGFTIMAVVGAFVSLVLIQVQNLVWNQTTLGRHRFRSRAKAGKAIFIILTNLVATALTFGLFTPFAQIRMLKYRIESMQMQPASSLDEFVAAETASVSALGEGMADVFDFDIAL